MFAIKPKPSKSPMGEVFRYAGKMKLQTIHFNKGTQAREERLWSSYKNEDEKEDALLDLTARGEWKCSFGGILSILRRLAPDSSPSSAKIFNTSCTLRKKVINQSNCVAPRHLASELKSSYWRLLKMTAEELCNYTKYLEKKKTIIKDG